MARRALDGAPARGQGAHHGLPDRPETQTDAEGKFSLGFPRKDLGEEINATFSRQNGCEIDRWDRLASVLQLEGA